MNVKHRRIVQPDDYPGLLNRGEAEAGIQVKMGKAYEILSLELEWGLGLFNRAVRSSPDTLVADAAARLFWLYLEALDATDLLISKGAIGPANVQARTLLEIGLQLLYLLKRNEERVAAAYTAHYTRKIMADNERFVAGSQMRKELETQVRRTKHLPDNFLSRFPDASDKVEELRRTLDAPTWRKANKELERLGNHDRWFRAFGGPSNLRELAREVEMEAWHWATYGSQSMPVHGATPQRVYAIVGEGVLKVTRLRDGEKWESLVTTCHVLNIEIYWAIIDHFRDGEREALKRWYVEQIRPKLEGSDLRDRVERLDV